MTPILEPKPNVRLHRNTPDALLDKVVDMISSSQGAPVPPQLRRALHGRHDARGQDGRGGAPHQRGQRARLRAGRLPGEHHGGQRPLGHRGQQPEPPQGRGAGAHRTAGTCSPSSTRSRERPRRSGRTARGPAMRPGSGPGRSSGTPTRADAIHRQKVRRSLRDLGIDAGAVLSHALPVLPGEGMRRKGARHHPGRGRSSTSPPSRRSPSPPPWIRCWRSSTWSSTRRNAPWRSSSRPSGTTGTGHEVLQAKAKFKAPKYGRDDDEADDMARKVMDLWTEETWKYKTKSTNRQFRPGMLCWNYWVGDGYILPREPGRQAQGAVPLERHLSLQRRRHQRPHRQRQLRGQGPGRQSRATARGTGGTTEQPAERCEPHHHLQSVAPEGPGAPGQVQGLPQGLCRERRHRPCRSTCSTRTCCGKRRRHPQSYRHLLVRVTGYNAYFTSIGRELQDEIIARESHKQY